MPTLCHAKESPSHSCKGKKSPVHLGVWHFISFHCSLVPRLSLKRDDGLSDDIMLNCSTIIQNFTHLCLTQLPSSLQSPHLESDWDAFNPAMKDWDFDGFSWIFQPTFPMKIWMSDSDGFRMFSSVIDFDTARSFLWNQALPLFTTDWGIWVVSQGPTHSSSNEIYFPTNLAMDKYGKYTKIHENTLLFLLWSCVFFTDLPFRTEISSNGPLVENTAVLVTPSDSRVGTSREMPWKTSIGFRQIGTSSRCFCHNQKSGDSQAFQAFPTIFSSEINMKSAESCWMYPSDPAKDASSELSSAGVALCHCPKTWPSRVLENSWHWGHGLRSLGNRLVEYCNIFIIDTVWYDII